MRNIWIISTTLLVLLLALTVGILSSQGRAGGNKEDLVKDSRSSVDKVFCEKLPNYPGEEFSRTLTARINTRLQELSSQWVNLDDSNLALVAEEITKINDDPRTFQDRRTADFEFNRLRIAIQNRCEFLFPDLSQY